MIATHSITYSILSEVGNFTRETTIKDTDTKDAKALFIHFEQIYIEICFMLLRQFVQGKT